MGFSRRNNRRQDRRVCLIKSREAAQTFRLAEQIKTDPTLSQADKNAQLDAIWGMG